MLFFSVKRAFGETPKKTGFGLTELKAYLQSRIARSLEVKDVYGSAYVDIPLKQRYCSVSRYFLMSVLDFVLLSGGGGSYTLASRCLCILLVIYLPRTN